LAKSRVAIAAASIAVVIFGAFAVYAGVTYPKTVLTIPISFTLGADVRTMRFDQSFLNSYVEVKISVASGAALWRARILYGDETVWEHSAGQGEQTTYESGWINLPSGSYNFTFGTVGAGSLDAKVTVSSKGGFW
jgi:hypothetical protein